MFQTVKWRICQFSYGSHSVMIYKYSSDRESMIIMFMVILPQGAILLSNAGIARPTPKDTSERRTPGGVDLSRNPSAIIFSFDVISYSSPRFVFDGCAVIVHRRICSHGLG